MIAENTKPIHFTNFFQNGQSNVTIATVIFSKILPLVFRKGKFYRANFLQKGKIGNFFLVENNFLAWNFFHFFSGISFQL